MFRSLLKEETLNSTEKAVIVGMQTVETDADFNYSIKELENLVENTGIEIVGELTQKRDLPDQKTFIGKGKVNELKHLLDSTYADVAIFNQELSPSQVRNLQEELDVKVIDRIQVILDIFALRAHTKEGKLQVHLAQLNYLLPRLAGHGINMSRLGGGIGTRGPGETKLETDRRHINNQIADIRRELKKIEKHRQRSRQLRLDSQVIQISLIGYTNAGKSSLLNSLTDAETFEKNILFATLDPLTRKMELPSGLQVTLTDTVGFIQNLPTELIESFKSTLEESSDADLLLHVVDVTEENIDLHEETVNQLLKDLDMSQIPVLTVYNKRDLLQEDFVPTMYPNILVSAHNSDDMDQLKEKIEELLIEQMAPYHIEIPANRGDLLYELKQNTIVTEDFFDEKKACYVFEGYVKKSYKWFIDEI